MLNDLTLRAPTSDCEVSIAPDFGGHITAFSLGGRNCLVTDAAEVGSTFWPSPQSSWGWPPPFILDKGRYHVEHSDDQKIAVASDVCSITAFSVSKRLEWQGSWLHIDYTLRNCSEIAQPVAPWEITRLPGGLSFYPAQTPPRQMSVPNGEPQDCNAELASGCVWHDYAPHTQRGHAKLFGFGGGWLANLHDDLLFIKRFPPVEAQHLAPGQALIEIYAHGDCSAPYIELEQQGRYVRLEPQAWLTWPVSWRVVHCPGNPGYAELATLAQRLIEEP